MLKPAKRNSLRGRLALGMKALGQTVAKSAQGAAMAIGGYGGLNGGYEGGRRDTRRTRNWRPGQGSAATDILPDLAELRGRTRDLDRNHPITHGALNTRANGIVGGGLQLRSVIDAKVLGLGEDPDRVEELQYTIEREWEIFEEEADFTGQLHLKDLQWQWIHSIDESGDIGIARRYRKRLGDTYGTRLVTIEADRISNPHRQADTELVQGGVELSAAGEVLGYHVSDRHPGTLRGVLSWSLVPRRGAGSGLRQFILAGKRSRPGQVRGVPIAAVVVETLKQLGDYTNAEIKAAINDAYLFAFEQMPSEVDDEGQPIIIRPDGETDAAGELTLEDLTITTLPPGSTVNVKTPSRPNTGFDKFVMAFCKYIGAGLGLPYEVLMMHFGSSFSASRGALEMAFKTFLVDRARFERSVLDQVRIWQFVEMVASGRFEAPGFFENPIIRRAWLGREWIGPTRIQINPQVEANADRIDMEGGVKSREQVMTERTGGSFDTKARQILRERQLLGETPAGDPQQQQQAEPNNDGTDPTEQQEDAP